MFKGQYFKRNCIAVIISLLLLAVFTVHNYCIFQRLREIFFIDCFIHFLKSLQVLEYLKAGNLTAIFYQTVYPPLFHLHSALFYRFFGISLETAFWSQFLFWVILVFSLYGIGTYLFSPLVGVLTVLVYLTSPTVLLIAPCYLLDIPSAAMLALCFYLLLKTENFQRRSYSLLFGAALGLGLMVKWWVGYQLSLLLLFYLAYVSYTSFKKWLFRLSAPAIIAIFFWFITNSPCCNINYSLYNATAFHLTWGVTLIAGILLWLLLNLFGAWANRRGEFREEKKAGFHNWLDSGFLTYLICGWLYFSPYFALLRGHFSHYWVKYYPNPAVNSGLLDIFSRQAGIFVREFRQVSGYPVFLIGLLLGAAFYLLKFREKKLNWLLPAALASSLLLLMFTDAPEIRYFVCWLVFAAPFSVFWVDYLKKGKIPVMVILAFSSVLMLFSGWMLPESWLRSRPALLFFLGGTKSLLLNRQDAGQSKKFNPQETEIALKVLPDFPTLALQEQLQKIYRRSLRINFQIIPITNTSAFSPSSTVPRIPTTGPSSDAHLLPPPFWIGSLGLSRERLANYLGPISGADKTEIANLLSGLSIDGVIILAGTKFNRDALVKVNPQLSVFDAPPCREAVGLLYWTDETEAKLSAEQFISKYAGRRHLTGCRLKQDKRIILPQGRGVVTFCLIERRSSDNQPFPQKPPQKKRRNHSLELQRAKFIGSLPRDGEPILLFELPPKGADWLTAAIKPINKSRLKDYHFLLTVSPPGKQAEWPAKRLEAKGWHSDLDLKMVLLSTYREEGNEYCLWGILHNRFLVN